MTRNCCPWNRWNLSLLESLNPGGIVLRCAQEQIWAVGRAVARSIKAVKGTPWSKEGVHTHIAGLLPDSALALARQAGRSPVRTLSDSFIYCRPHYLLSYLCLVKIHTKSLLHVLCTMKFENSCMYHIFPMCVKWIQFVLFRI